MHLLFDHLSAALVGASVMLMLLSLQLRLSGMNLEQTSTYIVKNQASNLATWMEEDLLRMGENMDLTAALPFTNPVDSAGLTTAFTFFRDSVDTGVTPPDTFRIETRYTLHKHGQYDVGGETIDVYRVARSVRTNGGLWRAQGNSPPSLGFFKIEMLDGDAVPVADPVGAATANPLAVRNTRVRFFMVTPFASATTAVRRVYYGSTLLIPN